MDINYYKQYEPIFGSWYITRLIGEGSFGKVFEMEREDFGQVYKAALKAITIPASQSEVRSVRSEGMDEESVRATFESKVQELVKEFALMSKLKGNSNVVSYENHQVIEHKDNIGWDILIQMELLTPLDEYIQKKKALPRQEIIKLGIDLCKALELCQKHNIIHRDIKPENTFISENGDFKLGDFGVARTVEKTTGGLSKQGSYPYMAPEVYNGKPYGTTVDIYSLGLILYRLLNGNRLPFLPAAPAPITYADRENAMAKRFNGAPLPMPSHADGRLGEIVLKACAFEPKDRYSSPGQMRQELEAILYSREEGQYIYPDGDEVPQDSIHSVKNDDASPIRQEEGTVSDFGGTVSDFGKTVSDFGNSAWKKEGTVSDFDGNSIRGTKNVQPDRGNCVKLAPEKTARGKLDWALLAVMIVCLSLGFWTSLNQYYGIWTMRIKLLHLVSYAVLMGATVCIGLSGKKPVQIIGLLAALLSAALGIVNEALGHTIAYFPIYVLIYLGLLFLGWLLRRDVPDAAGRRKGAAVLTLFPAACLSLSSTTANVMSGWMALALYFLICAAAIELGGRRKGNAMAVYLAAAVLSAALLTFYGMGVAIAPARDAFYAVCIAVGSAAIAYGTLLIRDGRVAKAGKTKGDGAK